MTIAQRPWISGPLGRFMPLQRGFDLPTRSVVSGSVPVVYSNGVGTHHNRVMVNGPGVVTGRSGTIGRVHFIEGDFWPHNTALWVTNFTYCHPKFTYYYLQYVGLERFGGGSGVPTLNRNDVHSFEITIPESRDEQVQIASALADVDSLIETLEQQIAKKFAIKQGMMQQLLTGETRLQGFSGPWSQKRIGDFTRVHAGGTPSTAVERYWGGDVPWMSSGEVHQKQVWSKNVHGRITMSGLKESSAQLFPEGTVLIALAGQGKTRGTIAISRNPLSTNQSIAGIYPSYEHDSNFLYFNLDSRYAELRGESAGDGGRGGLNLTIIKSLEVPFPEVSEQRAVAEVLLTAEHELNCLSERLKKAKDIKQGMMQELLTGRTRLPAVEVAL